MRRKADREGGEKKRERGRAKFDAKIRQRAKKRENRGWRREKKQMGKRKSSNVKRPSKREKKAPRAMRANKGKDLIRAAFPRRAAAPPRRRGAEECVWGGREGSRSPIPDDGGEALGSSRPAGPPSRLAWARIRLGLNAANLGQTEEKRRNKPFNSAQNESGSSMRAKSRHEPASIARWFIIAQNFFRPRAERASNEPQPALAPKPQAQVIAP